MSTQRHHQVKVQDLDDSERLLLKMIFSVSRQTPTRQHGYEICADSGNYDIVIAARDAVHNAGAVPLLVLTDVAGPNRIERPLLASRVLRILDDAVTSNVSKPDAYAPLAAVQDILSAPIQREERLANFSISAEEAQELAIVQDDALEHPANHESALESIAPVLAADSLRTAASAGQPAQVRRVLVVDDSASVRKQLEIELTHFDAEVDYAASARQAIDMIEANRYDIALLDVVLPDWDGFSICKKVKAESPSTIAVMLTSKATQADKLKGTLAGCDAYLVKPVGRRAFQAVVIKYLPPAKTSHSLSA
ncbi:MAG: response regulator [Gammaproteobacteria bacterium]|nr:response regulator [Gammaproteobacteria bacterium]